jgi:hypothetical protein
LAAVCTIITSFSGRESGEESRGNRTTVCAAHRLHAIDAGIIRVTGRAPDALEWEMGRVRLRGDGYADTRAYAHAA